MNQRYAVIMNEATHPPCDRCGSLDRLLINGTCEACLERALLGDEFQISGILMDCPTCLGLVF